MTKALCFGVLLVAASGAACGGQRAALNQATLRSSQCGPADVACRQRGMSAPLAVGATFRPNIDLEIPGAGGAVFHLLAAQPDIITVKGHTLEAKAEGTTAVLMSTGDAVVDFMHLSTKAVSEIRLYELGRDVSSRGQLRGEVGLVEGEALYVMPAPFVDGQRLAGHAEAKWTSSSDNVQILRDGTPHRRRLIARAPGKATVTVSLLGKQTVLNIDVVKGAQR